MCGNSALASMKTAWPPNGTTTGTPPQPRRGLFNRADPVAQVVVIDGLTQPLSDRLQVAPAQSCLAHGLRLR